MHEKTSACFKKNISIFSENISIFFLISACFLHVCRMTENEAIIYKKRK